VLATYAEACHHLVAFGYLVFDDELGIGEGSVVLGDALYIGLARRALAW